MATRLNTSASIIRLGSTVFCSRAYLYYLSCVCNGRAHGEHILISGPDGAAENLHPKDQAATILYRSRRLPGN
jgi:hypothetical protein